MTGIEVYQKLRASGCGDSILDKMRPWLRENPSASGESFQAWCQAVSKPEEANAIAAGTLNKISLILAGKDPNSKRHRKPHGWDELIDGPWEPGAQLELVGAAKIQEPVINPSATKGVETIPAPSPNKPSKVQVIQVQKPVDPQGGFDLGPKKVQ